MGPLTPEALGGYKYSTKISDEHTKWAETYLLKSKHEALASFQVFAQYGAIPSGFRVERLRVDKGREFVGKEVHGYYVCSAGRFGATGCRTPRSVCIFRANCYTRRSRICDLFESSVPGPS